VNKAALTVTANNASRAYGAANPAFTYSLAGFVNGETSAVVSGTATEATSATTTSVPGSYPITFATKNLAATNYTFNYVNGTLTVNAATQTITFSALSNVTYGVTPITLGATASSGLAVNYTVTGPAAVNGSILTINGTGTVRVTASQSGNANYAATSVVQSFTILRATLTVTATSVSLAHGQPIPVLTFTVSGFGNGDRSTVVTGTPAELRVLVRSTESCLTLRVSFVICRGPFSARSSGP
jgi:hypothetical protein